MKMSTQMDKLLATQKKTLQKLHNAQMEEKRIRKAIDALQRKERTHRLCTRAGYLEKLLIEPELFSDEDVIRYLDYALNTPYAKKALENLLEAKRKEIAEKQAAEAVEVKENEAGKAAD